MRQVLGLAGARASAFAPPPPPAPPVVRGHAEDPDDPDATGAGQSQ